MFEYRRFMREGVGLGKQPELTGDGLLRSLGGWSQVVAKRRSGNKEEGDERILGSGDLFMRYSMRPKSGKSGSAS